MARKGTHHIETTGERPDRWPDELCEKCQAPDYVYTGPLWTCPWRKKAKQDGKDKA